MLMIIHRPFLKAAAAFCLISPLVSANTVAGTVTTSMTTTHEQQRMRRQQDDVNAHFGVPRSEYDIAIEASNDAGWAVSDSVQALFDAAIQKWPEFITGDLPDVSTGANAGTSTSNFGGAFGTCLYPEMIDDLWICVSAGNLGGVSNGSITLGYATFLDQRANNGLPVTGVIAFNNEAQGVVALDNAALLIVTIHEIGHVLGIGTLWTSYGLSTSGVPPCVYTSSGNATAEYLRISGCSNEIPLEESQGDGSDCSHWDETCFVNELMTPSNNGGSDPISKVTIGTLDDLGYIVDYSLADKYTGFNHACKCTRDPASTDETTTTTTTTTTHQVDETRHKRSLADADHPDAHAIAKAKEILATMIDEAPGHDDVPPADGSNIMTPTSNYWMNVVTYDINTKTSHSYILTPNDL